MKQTERKKQDLMNAVQREKRRNYTILYTTTLLVWIVLVIISFLKGYFTGEEFIVNVVNNIIGILPPILLFDFFNEKLSRDASTIEMSNKITETLMSNPDTLDLFTEEQKKTFIRSTIASIVKDADATEMVNDSLRHFLFADTNYRVRTAFSYNFELDETLPAIYDTVLTDPGAYFYVQEKLAYRIKYLSDETNNMKSNLVKVGFAFDNVSLDTVLRDTTSDEVMSNCIFRESLDIQACDVQRIRAIATDKVAFQKLLKLDIQIDQFKGQLEDVQVCAGGIACLFRVPFDCAQTEHSVRIIFHMPKRWDSVLEVALMDPVRAPQISLSYPEDFMKVEMYSFLSKGAESSLEVAHEDLNGIYDVSLSSEWVYPISGMIFSVARKEAALPAEGASL